MKKLLILGMFSMTIPLFAGWDLERVNTSDCPELIAKMEEACAGIEQATGEKYDANPVAFDTNKILDMANELENKVRGCEVSEEEVQVMCDEYRAMIEAM